MSFLYIKSYFLCLYFDKVSMGVVGLTIFFLFFTHFSYGLILFFDML